MDYVLDILTTEQKLLNECTQILDEIERHTNEIEKLKERIRNLKDQLASFEASKTTKPQLDKDGCLYWDHVIKNEE
jgi:predicted  nucleic acid-binding Zn-ribbon protein